VHYVAEPFDGESESRRSVHGDIVPGERVNLKYDIADSSGVVDRTAAMTFLGKVNPQSAIEPSKVVYPTGFQDQQR
jgi:hypothetical protein